jgi:hypothetical protein
MAGKTVKINRAPVLTLWAAVVAERLGYDRATSLTLGKAVAGLNAQSKGRRLGIYEDKPDAERTGSEDEAKTKQKREAPPGPVTVLGRAIPVTNTKSGLRATIKDEPISPESVERYLKSKFGDALPDVTEAMHALAGAYTPQQLAAKGFELYEDFRPNVPEGVKGWGAAGELKLDRIRALAKRAA